MATATEDKKANASTFNIERKVSIVIADTSGKPHQIMAAASDGNVPSEFELLKVGMWRTPWHGDIMIMPEDLQEYVEHYEAGYAVSGNGKLKLPINYNHNQSDKAAGWFVPSVKGDTLMATEVEWTPAARKALLDGEYKCISAEFYPKGRGGWCNPLDMDEYVENVIEGAALTNIPLMNQLEPVMASAASGEEKPKVFILASNVKENDVMPTLEEVRVKEVSDLDEDDKKVLAEHKSELTEDECKKFGFEVKANKDDKKEPNKVSATITEEDQKILAAIRGGNKVLMSKEEVERLQQTATDFRTKEAADEVDRAIARGALKADRRDKWIGRLVKANTDERKELVEELESLPTNPVLAESQGSDKDAGDATEAEATVHEKTVAAVKAAAEKGKELRYSEAREQVLAENKDLAESLNNK